MAKPRRKECAEYRCRETAVIGRLCQQHFDERERRRLREDTATQALNTGCIDGEYLPEGALRDELWRVRDWWHKACSAMIANREHPVLRDETEYAMYWCIELAALITDEHRHVGGEANMRTLQYLRNDLWQRFANLERGLMSNGVARPAEGR